VSPLISIELLSPGTEKEDLGQTLRSADQSPTKWQVYEQILRVPYYVVFDRYSNQLRVFALQGDRCQEQPLDEYRIWIPSLELGLGLWEGVYRGLERLWLRWYDVNGTWLLNRDEQTSQERQCAERLASRLRELGIDPEDF
jgi:Putative restriction endonuclease